MRILNTFILQSCFTKGCVHGGGRGYVLGWKPPPPPACTQERSQSQESTDMLSTPAGSSSTHVHASFSLNKRRQSITTDQSHEDTDSPTPQRPGRATAYTHLHQSPEEAFEEKEQRRKAHRCTPCNNKHAPYTRANSYRVYKATGTTAGESLSGSSLPTLQ